VARSTTIKKKIGEKSNTLAGREKTATERSAYTLFKITRGRFISRLIQTNTLSPERETIADPGEKFRGRRG
jgi:hypothetical protein